MLARIIAKYFIGSNDLEKYLENMVSRNKFGNNS